MNGITGDAACVPPFNVIAAKRHFIDEILKAASLGGLLPPHAQNGHPDSFPPGSHHAVDKTSEIEGRGESEGGAGGAEVDGGEVGARGGRPHVKPVTGACKVCGDDASGMYFGALVCVSCKTFFLRYDGNEVSFVCKSSRDCPITVTSRTQCKFCRYHRCLMAGMYRRVRPAHVFAIAGQQLCAVCGDIGNGVHFGAVTCEGCKKFFRRGLTEQCSYVCMNDGRCTINPRTRNSCRFCRYQKCLTIGMSRDAIQMGRPSRLTESVPSIKSSGRARSRANRLLSSQEVNRTRLEGIQAHHRRLSTQEVDGARLEERQAQQATSSMFVVRRSYSDAALRPHADCDNNRVLDLSRKSLDLTVDSHRGKVSHAIGSYDHLFNRSESIRFSPGIANHDSGHPMAADVDLQPDSTVSGSEMHLLGAHALACIALGRQEPTRRPAAGITASISAGITAGITAGNTAGNTAMGFEMILSASLTQPMKRSRSVSAECKMDTNIPQNVRPCPENASQGDVALSAKRLKISHVRQEVEDTSSSDAIGVSRPLANIETDILDTRERVVSNTLNSGNNQQLFRNDLKIKSEIQVNCDANQLAGSDCSDSVDDMDQSLAFVAAMNQPCPTSLQRLRNLGLLQGGLREIQGGVKSVMRTCSSPSVSSSVNSSDEVDRKSGVVMIVEDKKEEELSRYESRQVAKLSVNVETMLRVSREYWLRPVSVPEGQESRLLATSHWEVINRIIPTYDRFVQLGTGINRTLKAEFDEWMKQQEGAVEGPSLAGWIQNKVVPVYTTASVAYCKSLVGFDSFDADDQVTIIRLGQSPSRILVAAFHWFDAEQRQFRNFLSWRDSRAGGRPDLFKSRLIDYAEGLSQLQLDPIEAALVNVLIIFATDYPSLRNEGVIEEMRQRILATFTAYAAAKFGASNDRLATVFSQMPEVRRLGLLHHQMTKTRTMTAEEVEENETV